MHSQESPKDIKKEELHPEKMRAFIRHLSAAAIKAEERSMKKNRVKEHLEKIKTVALNKRSTKDMIEGEVGTFESAIHEIINDEEKILEQQRNETRQINELKTMVESLSKKLIDIGREYARELEEKDNKIMELREALASAHIKISETGGDRQKKIEDIERRIKQKAREPEPAEEVKESVEEVETQIALLESKHKELKKKGKHRKQDLDRLKKIIDQHKEAISKIKKKR